MAVFCGLLAEEQSSIMIQPIAYQAKMLNVHRIPAAGASDVATMKYAG
ncbi:MAG: hypothetical protein LBE78_07565 [Burkholderiaceae bacterium]|jgi:hypothetical protein|nr:hypothetical protein [Burkholderiaceae bacterium]